MKKKVGKPKQGQKAGEGNDPPTRRIDPQEQQIRGIPLFPLSVVKRKLRYAETFTMSTSTPSIAGSYVFMANGLYDPNITGTGHQPIGFDQMMLSYEHYIVTRAKVTATFRNQLGVCSAAIRLSGNPNPTTLPDQLLEDGRINRVHITPVNIPGFIQTLEQSIDIAKAVGVRDVRDEFDLRGSVTTNPNEGEYFHLHIWENGPTTAGLSVSVDIFLEFEAWFTEPRDMTESLKKLRALEDQKYPPQTRRGQEQIQASLSGPGCSARTDGVCACTVPLDLRSLPLERQAANAADYRTKAS